MPMVSASDNFTTGEGVAVTQKKPRLVFFQFEYSPKLPEFLLIHKREHVACLSEFFEVAVVDKDCDYQEVCDTLQPDMCLFESGVPNPACRRLTITNTHTNANIPKLGFLHADAFCCAREGFLSDMYDWGIEWFTAIATSAPEHMPAIADRMFIWPNSVDPSIYRDYGQWKSIPVLFTGNKNDIYPWRQKIIKLVPSHFPTMICPHPGYATRQNIGHVPVGEPYARMLNAAWFVPACGTVAKEVVRKHFEVPACGSCLVTERSPALEAAGFVDLENCVFADEHNVIDKLSRLFAEPERLRAVTQAGHQLVMSRHTNKHRSQVLQWYKLHKQLQPGQIIEQPNPFGDLSIAKASGDANRSYSVSGAHHLALLRQGDERLWAGDCEEAERLYLRSANYISYMPEPKFRLALCNLYRGRAAKGLWWIAQPLQFTLAQYKATAPDPVEWAYFVVALLCSGDVSGAAKSAGEFEWLHHPELDRARLITHVLSHREPIARRDETLSATARASIHQLPERDLRGWLEQIEKMLRACRQDELARRVAEFAGVDYPARTPPRAGRPAASDGKAAIVSNLAWYAVLRSAKRAATALLWRAAAQSFASRLKAVGKKTLHGVETRFGYILPYRFSAARRHDPFRLIEGIARDDEIKTALIIGARRGDQRTEALIAGAGHNSQDPAVICIAMAGKNPRTRRGATSPAGDRKHWYTWPVDNGDSAATLGETLEKAKRAHGIETFDLVLVNGSELGSDFAGQDDLQSEVEKARAVVLDDIHVPPVGDIHHRALRTPGLVMVDLNNWTGDGFSIFARVNADIRPRPLARTTIAQG